MNAPRRRGLGRALGLTLALLVAVGAGFWAGRTTMGARTGTTPTSVAPLVAQVTQQTLGRHLNLSVTVSQPKRPLATNPLTGVVTKVSPAGRFTAGQVLFVVGDRPVRVVAGARPFFRDLALGDKGWDVQQLRNALVTAGHATTSGDSFDAATEASVKQWQRELGAPVTGKVDLGELVAAPSLPAALSFDDALQPGAVLAGGEKLVLASAGQPSFSMVLAEQQAALVPQTSTVQVTHEGKTWPAVIAGSEVDRNGQTVLHLTAPDGGVVCGKDCGLLPAGAETYLMSKVEVVPPVTGPAVPVAAITTDAEGQAWVATVDAAGKTERRSVQVLGSQDGLAVVKGVTVGERVQVLASGGQDAPQPTAQPSASPSR